MKWKRQKKIKKKNKEKYHIFKEKYVSLFWIIKLLFKYYLDYMACDWRLAEQVFTKIQFIHLFTHSLSCINRYVMLAGFLCNSDYVIWNWIILLIWYHI
jgi:hypothetical protein